jgi:hypothetical protein
LIAAVLGGVFLFILFLLEFNKRNKNEDSGQKCNWRRYENWRN